MTVQLKRLCKEVDMQRDKKIQLLRIMAMFMIVACHLVQEYNSDTIAMTAQFFNVGVYVFFLISGFLYGGKEIGGFLKWFIKRMTKLLIPVYIFLIFVFAMNYLILGSFSIEKIFVYLFNLQGVFGTVLGASHLWFLTTIMFCYGLIPLFSVIRKWKSNLRSGLFLLAILMMALIISFTYKYAGQQLFYILTFALGYLFGPKLKKIPANWAMLLCTIGLMFIIRLVARKFVDGTILYDVIVSSITHIVISVSLFVAIFKINLKTKEKTLNRLDSMSYYIYIVHYIFMVGPLRLMGATDNSVVNTALTIIASYVAAEILKVLTTGVYKLVGIEKKKHNMELVGK